MYEKVAGELGYDPKSAITLPFLFEQMQAFSGGQVSQKEDLVRSDLRLAVEEALKAFSYMKQTEGGILVEEIRGHLDKFEGYVRLVESKTADAEERYKAKLLARIEEAKLLQPEDHERVVREVMIYAEKIDITEEIARLGSHLQQFRGIFSASEGSVGRTMDFLLQEMNREVNTIASKSDDGEISANAIYMKSLLEKIREQVQNIE